MKQIKGVGPLWHCILRKRRSISKRVLERAAEPVFAKGFNEAPIEVNKRSAKTIGIDGADQAAN
jgi:hypothetical protein